MTPNPGLDDVCWVSAFFECRMLILVRVLYFRGSLEAAHPWDMEDPFLFCLSPTRHVLRTFDFFSLVPGNPNGWGLCL